MTSFIWGVINHPCSNDSGSLIWYGNVFRFTNPLWENPLVDSPRRGPVHKGPVMSFDLFFLLGMNKILTKKQTKQTIKRNSRVASDLRRHGGHVSDISVMIRYFISEFTVYSGPSKNLAISGMALYAFFFLSAITCTTCSADSWKNTYLPLGSAIGVNGERCICAAMQQTTEYHKSHNAPVPYPTIHHWIVGYGTCASWDVWELYPRFACLPVSK